MFHVCFDVQRRSGQVRSTPSASVCDLHGVKHANGEQLFCLDIRLEMLFCY